MSAISEALSGLPYFADLPEDVINGVSVGSERIELDAGTTIIEEGSHSEEMYVIISGQLDVTINSGGKDVDLARLGPGDVVGEIALLDDAPRTATVRTAEPSTVIRIPAESFEALLADSGVVRRMFRTVTARLRDIEDTLRHEERMAALGRMAAQLMHELNNPAAAVGRSSQELVRLNTLIGEEAGILSGVLTEGAGPVERPEPVELTPLQRGRAESSLVDWLSDHGVPDPWDIAPPMVEAGWTPEQLDKVMDPIADELLPHYVRYVGLSDSINQVTGELGVAARRMSELVRVVKDYSYLDQAPIQVIDLAPGIGDTLILLKHKLRGVEVVVDIEEGLARVEAPGRDLNQVWTNLIDNAADAMEGAGTLTILGRNRDECVEITVNDTGGGIPEEIISRIFDPFYTTKEPGKGTGLGLHTVHTIVNRAGGTIEVANNGEGATFTVRLPIAE